MECKSVSGKSTLTYTFTKVAKGDTEIKIEGNTGAGLFSNEVVSLKLLEKALAKKTFTSADIKPLLKGKSHSYWPLCLMKQLSPAVFFKLVDI